MTILTSLLLPMLGTTPGAAEAPAVAAADELVHELSVYIRTWNEQEEVLGERRLRNLRTARYHLSREDAIFSLLDDDPLAFEEARDIAKSVLLKLTRERLERHLPLERLKERFGSSRDLGSAEGGVRLRVSPRIGAGSRPYLGANLRLKGREEALWPRFTLGLRERLEGGDSIFLQYETDNRYFRLEHVFDHEDFGDQVVLSARLSF